MLRYATTIFISAFLLFQVQPIISRIILPWFGGSAAVWTTCLLFFQVALLLGYLYAHGSIRLIRPAWQGRVHAALLALSLFALPILPRESWKPTGAEDPTLRILLLLTVTIGLPYFLLSTTGPLLQAWFANSNSEEGPRPFPYRLYALSNLGSMLALLGYPTLVEPFLTLRQQALIWTAGYVAFVLICGYVALKVRGPASAPERPASAALAAEPAGIAVKAPTWRDYLLWTTLSACSCILLLSITTHLTQNIAPIPFLWILPLTLYLLSFIICFGPTTWRWNPYFLPVTAIALIAMTYYLGLPVSDTTVRRMILVFVGGLFACCVVCHGELARRKPAPHYLTAFYLTISAGGALGGLFVGVIAPRVFAADFELYIGLALCAIIVLFAMYDRPKLKPITAWALAASTALVVLSPHYFHGNEWLVGLGVCAVIVFVTPWDTLQVWSRTAWMLTAVAFMVMFFALSRQIQMMTHGYIRIARNFYGVLKVSNSAPSYPSINRRVLTNGNIMHGDQFVSGQARREPTSYYSPGSGVGLAIRSMQEKGPIRVGMIGLGAGTLASYGRKGDAYHFYEINPLVAEIARTDFTYLNDSEANTEVRMGDARLTMEREAPQDYDVLVVDAFSSDAIPVHLLTLEAMRLYFRHLKTSGVLAVHISNRYLDLLPVVAGEARALGKSTAHILSAGDEKKSWNPSQWVLVSGDAQLFDEAIFKGRLQPDISQTAGRVWTDDYSNLLQIMR